MNILILSWRGPGHTNEGGAEYVTHKHATAWVKAGHCVTLFTSMYSGAKEKEEIEGIEIIRRGEQNFGVKIWAFVWYVFEAHPNYDLVVDHFHGIPFFTPLYVRSKKLGFIHEVAKEVWRLNPWPKPLNLLPWILGGLLEKFIFLLYRRVPFITVSNSTRDDLLKWGISRKKISVIHNGIEKPKVDFVKKNKRKTAIYLGALAKDKGIEDALQVFRLLKDKKSGWSFLVAGRSDQHYNRFLSDFVRKNNLEKELEYFGFVSERKKYELLSKAHVLVNPSTREGWGLVNLEANSVGTPVVGYDVPGVRDSVVHNKTGILCKQKSPVCLAENADDLLNDNKRYERMNFNAKKWSAKFGWEKSVAKSLEIIENIVV